MNSHSPRNRLLLALPSRNLKQLIPDLEFIRCYSEQILLDADASLDHVFFPELILYIWGDNGASAEGQDGTISELLAQNNIPTTTKQQIKALDTLGGLDVLGSPKTDNMYHAGWAWAGSTPYQATKLIASHFGGTRNPLAIRWPAKIKPDATPRAQFLHVNDVVPTIYGILGITPPRVVNGIPQDPLDGASFVSTFNDAKGNEVKQTQYFEIMGSRGIYHDGWMASAFGPRVPWLPGLPKGIQEWTPLGSAGTSASTLTRFSLLPRAGAANSGIRVMAPGKVHDV